jgi:hypothetical protein
MSDTDVIPGAVTLLIEFLQHFQHDTHSSTQAKFKDRLKVILNCKNLEEFGLPSFITSYNAKPVLLRNVIFISLLIRYTVYLYTMYS